MVVIKYSDFVMHASGILSYAYKNCELFSLITEQMKPFSKRPPNCIHDKQLEQLNNSLDQQLVGIRKWANSGINRNHTVMNVYRLDKNAYDFLNTHMERILCDNSFPEDICFYKNRKIWISTVKVDELAFMYDASPNDLLFWDNENISYSYVHDDSDPFILHY